LFSGARVCDPQPLPSSKDARKRSAIWNFARCCGSQTRAPLNRYAVATSAFFALLALIAQNCLADAPLAPVLYSHPHSRTVPTGTLVTFKVDANGYPTLNYRWRRNGATYSSTNSSTLNVVAAGVTNWLFDVVITNAFGAITSS